MPIKLNLTLVHANWCGHCRDFMPEWAKFTERVNNKDFSISKCKIKCKSIESSELTDGNKIYINEKEVDSYPTLKIAVVSDGKTLKEIQYEGKRLHSEIESYLKLLAGEYNM